MTATASPVDLTDLALTGALAPLVGTDGLAWVRGTEHAALFVEAVGVRLVVTAAVAAGGSVTFDLTHFRRGEAGELRFSSGHSLIRSARTVAEEVHWRLGASRGISV